MEANEKKVLVLSCALMLFFFLGLVWAYRSYGVTIPDCVSDIEPFEKGQVIQRGERDYEVQMVARMWKFDPGEVTLPPGSRVSLYLSSRDVVHGMQILGTNVNLMAIPGTVNYAEVTFESEGEYSVVCHEYCGRNHQSMHGKFIVKESAPEPPPAPGAADPPIEEPEEPESAEPETTELEAMFEAHDCLMCHPLDGTTIEEAPSLFGLLGQSRTLTDGRTVTADEAYIRKAIADPESEVVEGYEPMPELGEIPEEDLRKMIEGIMELGKPGDPADPESAEPESTEPESAELEALFEAHDCLMCHPLDGTTIEEAPSLFGLLGQSRTLTDGRTVTADEAYIRKAIADPESEVVEGYEPMPELGEIPEEDLQKMIEGIKELVEQTES